MSDYAKFYCNFSRRYLTTPRTQSDAFREADYAIAIERHRPLHGQTSEAFGLLILSLVCAGFGFVIAALILN